MLILSTAGQLFVSYARQKVFQADVRCGSSSIDPLCDASEEDFNAVLTSLTKLRA